MVMVRSYLLPLIGFISVDQSIGRFMFQCNNDPRLIVVSKPTRDA